jgi:lysozyme family protein
MASNFAACLAHVLKHEGGFTNHPRDPGGMTNLGVTRRAWAEWTKRKLDEVDEREMRDLLPENVEALYLERYWRACRCDDLPAGIDYAVFDCAVNSGPSRSAKILQETLSVTADGRIGPATIKAAQEAGITGIIHDAVDARLEYLRGLSTWDAFGRGWERRCEDVRKVALEMADKRGSDGRDAKD